MSDEIEALVTDGYLDALLAAIDRHADDAPSDGSIDPEVREAARILRASLVRVHPSFRFEERLAGRLADLAASQARPALAAASGSVVDLREGAAAILETDPLVAAIIRGELDPTDEDAVERGARQPATRRPLIVGGAITSAAISLVGVAYVAWRASRPAAQGRAGNRASNRAMARAARAARARRAAAGVSALVVTTASTAAAAAGTAGLGGPT
jgi:hypothetical protein